MSDVPLFLARLGLGEHAASADIRRAYARELKLIDQERNAAGFQALREDYETAMFWARHGGADQHEADAPAIPQFGVQGVPVTLAKAPGLSVAPAAVYPEKTQSQVNPHALASDVFARFTADFAAMLGDGTATDLADCRALLERVLGDAALLNISARLHFEGRMAHLLAGGWKPGHEVLLVPAVNAFEWGCDRRRLLEFGADGAQLWQAIHERMLFDSQSDVDMQAQGQVVGRLRTDVPPDAGELVRAMPHLDALEARFPTWLALVTDVAKIPVWRALEQQVPAWRRRLMFESKAKVAASSDQGSSGLGWGTWLTVVFVINMIRMLMQDGSTPASAPQVEYGQPKAVTVYLPVGKPSDEQIARILALVQYQPPPSMRDELQVEFLIVLDDERRVSAVEVNEPSRDGAYDAAVAAAIRAAPQSWSDLPSAFRWYHIRPAPAH